MLSLFQESLIAWLLRDSDKTIPHFSPKRTYPPSLSALPSEFSTAPTREQIESGDLFVVSEVKYKVDLSRPAAPAILHFV
jgi:hypothetical protein